MNREQIVCFITAGPITKLFAWGGKGSGGHHDASVLRFYGKRSFSVTTPCVRPSRVNTERLAERETLLYRLGFELNRTV